VTLSPWPETWLVQVPEVNVSASRSSINPVVTI
jgi:hypothetical protein